MRPSTIEVLVAIREMLDRAALGGCLLLVTACGGDILAPDVTRVRLSLTVSQPEMVVGDTVEIRVVGANPTQDTLRFTTAECPVFHVRILHGVDQVVFRHPRTCNSIAIPRVIESGDSIVETVLFDGTVSSGIWDANGPRPALVLAPGRYTVVANFEGGAGNDSNPVELRIRP